MAHVARKRPLASLASSARTFSSITRVRSDSSSAVRWRTAFSSCRFLCRSSPLLHRMTPHTAIAPSNAAAARNHHVSHHFGIDLKLRHRRSHGNRPITNLRLDFQTMPSWRKAGKGDAPLRGIGPVFPVQTEGKVYQLLALVTQ